MKTKNISKLYEAFDAFTNKEFDASSQKLHEFFVMNAKEELKETWDAPMEDDNEDEFFGDEVGGDVGDSFEDDVTDSPEDDLGASMDVDVDTDVDDDSDGPASKQDVMDLEDKIDDLVKMFKDEAEFDFDDEEGEGDDFGSDDDDVDGDEDGSFGDDEEELELDESEEKDDDDEDDDKDEVDEGVSYSETGSVKSGDNGANAKSPHPKQNKGGKIEGGMGKTAKEETGRAAPSVKDEVQTKDGNQGSGKERQKKVPDSDKASKTPSKDDNVKSPMNKV